MLKKKSNFDTFRTNQKRIDYDVNIKIYDYSTNSLVSFERKECVRYLGVLIASKISWTHHITCFPTKNQQIIRHPCKTKAICPFFHFIKHISFSCTTLLVLRYSNLRPSRSYKFGENFDSSKTCLTIDSYQTL